MVNIYPVQIFTLHRHPGIGHQVLLAAHQFRHRINGRRDPQGTDIGDIRCPRHLGHRQHVKATLPGEHPGQAPLRVVAHWCVVYGVTLVRFHRENKRGDGVLHERADHPANFRITEQVTVLVFIAVRLPDQDTVLVDVRQVKAMAIKQAASGVQGPAGRYGVGNTPPAQLLQRIPCMF